MESQVTKPLEEALNTISGIDELNSTSAEGISLVVIGFVLEKDAEVAAQRCGTRFDSAVATASGRDPPW